MAKNQDVVSQLRTVVYEVFFQVQNGHDGRGAPWVSWVSLALLTAQILSFALPVHVLDDGVASHVATALSVAGGRFAEVGWTSFQSAAFFIALAYVAIVISVGAIIWSAVGTPVWVLVTASAGDYKAAASYPGLGKVHKVVGEGTLATMRLLLELCSAGFFIPLLAAFLSPFRCGTLGNVVEGDGPCWSTTHFVSCIAGAAGALLLVGIAASSAMLTYPRDMGTMAKGLGSGSRLSNGKLGTSPLRRAHWRSHFVLLATLGGLCVVHTLDGLVADWFGTAASLAGLIVIYRETYTYLPFASMVFNRRMGGLLGGAIWLAGNALFIVIRLAATSDPVVHLEAYTTGEWSMVLGLVPFSFVAMTLINQRWEAIDSWNDVATPLHLELRVRRLLALAVEDEQRLRRGYVTPALLVAQIQGAVAALTSHAGPTDRSTDDATAVTGGSRGTAQQRSGPISVRSSASMHTSSTGKVARSGSSSKRSTTRPLPSVTQMALDEAEELYADALDFFGNAPMMHILCARFMLTHRNNKHVGQSHYRAVMVHSGASMGHCFEAYQQQRRELNDHLIASSAKGTLSITARVGFERHKQEARDHEIAARSAIADFWSELLMPYPSGARLSTLAGSIRDAMQKADTSYRALIRLNSRSVGALRQYAQFVVEVSNDSKRGLQLISEADALEEQALEAKARQEDISFELMAKSPEELDTTAEDVGVLTASSNPSTVGTITDVNSAAVAMWGYSKREMIGSNLSMLMPEPISGMHDMVLRRYLAHGQSSVMDIPRMAVMLHKQGYLVPSALMIRNLGEEGFGGVIRPMQVKEHLIVCTAPNGIITGGCQRTMEALNLRPEKLRKGLANIQRYLPNINEFVYHLKQERGMFDALPSRGKAFGRRPPGVHQGGGFSSAPSATSVAAAGSDLGFDGFQLGPTDSSVIVPLLGVSTGFLTRLVQGGAVSEAANIDFRAHSMRVVVEVQVTKYVAPSNLPFPGRAVLIKWWELPADDPGSMLSGHMPPRPNLSVMRRTSLPGIAEDLEEDRQATPEEDRPRGVRRVSETPRGPRGEPRARRESVTSVSFSAKDPAQTRPAALSGEHAQSSAHEPPMPLTVREDMSDADLTAGSGAALAQEEAAEFTAAGVAENGADLTADTDGDTNDAEGAPSDALLVSTPKRPPPEQALVSTSAALAVAPARDTIDGELAGSVEPHAEQGTGCESDTGVSSDGGRASVRSGNGSEASSRQSRTTATMLRRAASLQGRNGLEPNLRILRNSYLWIIALVIVLNVVSVVLARTVLRDLLESVGVVSDSSLRERLSAEVLQLTQTMHIMSQTGAGDAADWTVVAAQLERTVDELEAVHRALYMEADRRGFEGLKALYTSPSIDLFALDTRGSASGTAPELEPYPSEGTVSELLAQGGERFKPALLANASATEELVGLLDAGLLYTSKARIASRRTRPQWHRAADGHRDPNVWFVLANGPTRLQAAFALATAQMHDEGEKVALQSRNLESYLMLGISGILLVTLLLVVLPIVIRIATKKNHMFRLFSDVPRLVLKHLRAAAVNKLRRLQLEKEAEESGGADELAELADRLALEGMAHEGIDWSAITFRDQQQKQHSLRARHSSRGHPGGGGCGCCSCFRAAAPAESPSGELQATGGSSPPSRRPPPTRPKYSPSRQEFVQAAFSLTLPLILMCAYYGAIYHFESKAVEHVAAHSHTMLFSSVGDAAAVFLDYVTVEGVLTDSPAAAQHIEAVAESQADFLERIGDGVAFGDARLELEPGMTSSGLQSTMFLLDGCLTDYQVFPIAPLALAETTATGTVLDMAPFLPDGGDGRRLTAEPRPRSLQSSGSQPESLLPYDEANVGSADATPLPMFYGHGSISADECLGFRNGLLRSGLTAARQDFCALSLQLLGQRVDQLTGGGTASTDDAGVGTGVSARNARLADQSVQELRIMGTSLLKDGLVYATSAHSRELSSWVNRHTGWSSALAVLSAVLVLVLYFVVVRPTIWLLDDNIKQSRAMILLLPDGVVRGVPGIHRLVKEVLSRHASTASAMVVDDVDDLTA